MNVFAIKGITEGNISYTNDPILKGRTTKGCIRVELPDIRPTSKF